MSIRICDALMGSGKTTAAINYMNGSDGKFIFITPFLSECDRIVDSCQIKQFETPTNSFASKLGSLHGLLHKKRNIASTHALFASYTDETVRLIREGEYTLILDEVFKVVDEMPVTKGDMTDLIEKKRIEVDEKTFKVTWLDDSYVGTSFEDLMMRSKTETVFYYNNTFLFWMFPPAIFEAFKDVIVLSYMFDAQLQRYYFDSNGLKYSYIDVVKDEEGNYQFADSYKGTKCIHHLNEKINILEDKRLNSLGDDNFAFSSSWTARAAKMKNGRLKFATIFIMRFEIDLKDGAAIVCGHVLRLSKLSSVRQIMQEGLFIALAAPQTNIVSARISRIVSTFSSIRF